MYLGYFFNCKQAPKRLHIITLINSIALHCPQPAKYSVKNLMAHFLIFYFKYSEIFMGNYPTKNSISIIFSNTLLW